MGGIGKKAQLSPARAVAGAWTELGNNAISVQLCWDLTELGKSLRKDNSGRIITQSVLKFRPGSDSTVWFNYSDNKLGLNWAKLSPNWDWNWVY